MASCNHCGKSKKELRATCPHCGKTEWDLFAGMVFLCLFGLGGMLIVREVDGPLYLAVIFGIVGGGCLILGLSWVKDLVDPPTVEEPLDAPTAPLHRVQASGSGATVTLPVPEDFFAVRFPHRCVYCGTPTEGGRKTEALRGIGGEPAIQLTYPLCSHHAKVVSRNDRVVTAALSIGALASFLGVLLYTLPDPPFGTSGLLAVLVVGGLALVAAVVGAGLCEALTRYVLFPVLTRVTGSRYDKELRGTYSLEDQTIQFGFGDAAVAQEFAVLNHHEGSQAHIQSGSGLGCPKCGSGNEWRGDGTKAIKASFEAADTDNLQVTCFSCGESSTRQDILEHLERWRLKAVTQRVPIVVRIDALGSRVGALLEAHPQSGTTAGGGVARAQKQIPWICRELGAASQALLTGRDPSGRSITPTQVSGGLEKLADYVRNPDYGALMELVYPGIDPPLQGCMDELETILREMKAEAAAKRSRRDAEKKELTQPDFARYDGTGLCDVCNGDLTPGEAFLVPSDVFWESGKYKAWFAATPQGMLAVQMGSTVDQAIATLRHMDKSKHSAVCPRCIHLFS